MRSVSEYPDAYDRLDRMSQLRNGQRTVRDLIRGPDGYKLIEYMTTASGGEHLGDMLADGPGGQGFNKPTGNIYTAGQLLEALHKSYEQETARRANHIQP
jgi:hypothetical protein